MKIDRLIGILSILLQEEKVMPKPMAIKNRVDIRVIFLLACCACKNISSAVTFHCSSNEIVLQFETVKLDSSFHTCFHTILIVHGFTDENVILDLK